MRRFTFLVAGGLALSATAGVPVNVAETPSRARTPQGQYISWREHLIDDQQLSGGVKLRGADSLQMADLDRDGHLDIVSVHEDSNHVRIAFGSLDPGHWESVTLADGDEAGAAEDSAIGDINRDGWPDVIVACELGHLIYFQNPGRDVRRARWPRVIPKGTRGRGSFIRVFLADFNQDRRLEVVTANKGEQLPTVTPGKEKLDDRPKRAISWFEPPAEPLSADGWREHVLVRVRVPINAQPVDLDGDGDLDIFAGSRGEQRVLWLENLGGKRIRFRERRIRSDPPLPLKGIMVDFHDFGRDGRLDVVMNDGLSSLAWFEQPASPAGPWRHKPIGGIAPDTPFGITVADINGDGRADVITGGYSQDPREHDGPEIGSRSIVGRITWFEQPSDPRQPWPRHDVSRTKRGMYDAFIARDVDGDGDTDFVGSRGNSGNFDGVYWIEQVRTAEPRRAFFPARSQESAHLPLPPP